MPKLSNVKDKKFKTNVERANDAINRARATVINSRRGLVAPPRTGGFYGLGMRPRGSGPELKAIDVTSAAAAMAASGVTGILLNGCIAGSDIGNRVGRKINMKSLMIRINFAPIISVPSPLGNLARAIVVYDSQTNITASTSTLLLNADNVLDPNKLENRERFTVLMDKFVSLPTHNYTGSVPVAGSPTQRLIKKFIRINKDTIYNAGSTGSVTDIVSGSLYLIVIALNATYSFQTNSRVRFVDN